jgi:putative intracellular protease/amidase
MAKILIPLPDKDFDVTEVAVPWRMLKNAEHEVVFATENGDSKPAADPLLLTGVIFGQLGAEAEPLRFYYEMCDDHAFQNPFSWSDLDVNNFDALLLPGGHAQGMRQYLGNTQLHQFLADFWATKRPVGAICHGVIPLARAKDAAGKSLLQGVKTTCLPKYMEKLAFYLTFWKLGNYYRTYPAYVEDEVREALTASDDFLRGPINLGKRGTASDHKHAFVVEDGHYISARWPGDAYLFAERFISLLEQDTRLR